MTNSVVLVPPDVEVEFELSINVSAVDMNVSAAIVGDTSIVAGISVGNVVGVTGKVVGVASSVAGNSVGATTVVAVSAGDVISVSVDSDRTSPDDARLDAVTAAGTGIGDVFKLA